MQIKLHNSHGRVFFRSARLETQCFRVQGALKYSGGRVDSTRQHTDGRDTFFSKFPSFTGNSRPKNSCSNVLECRVLDSLVLEVFPTQYSTRLDSIFVVEVRPSANSPKAGMFHKASVNLELQSQGLKKAHSKYRKCPSHNCSKAVDLF